MEITTGGWRNWVITMSWKQGTLLSAMYKVGLGNYEIIFVIVDTLNMSVKTYFVICSSDSFILLGSYLKIELCGSRCG